MNLRFLLPVVLVGVLAAAGCGGSSKNATTTTAPASTSAGKTTTSASASGDVAVVAGQHITVALLDELMSEAQTNFKLQGKSFPKKGTSDYTTIQGEAIVTLIQQAETQAEAGKLGIAVTSADVDKQLDAIKKSCCGGSEAQYQKALAQQGLTDKEVRDNARAQLYGQRLAAKLTKGITVTPDAIAKYYAAHQSDFKTQPSRTVRYILLGKNKADLASKLLAQLDGAPRATWCTLAKKYSQDPSSSGKCGEASFTQGSTVPEFDKVLFSLPTNKAGKVNSGQYGWFVLEPTAAASPVKTTPLAKATAKIKATILTTKKQAVISAWTTKTQKAYCKTGVITYGSGYKPSPDPCASTGTATSTIPTTTTG
jgi:parvulin-like peptidyl-prolyl isomerase